MGLLVNISYMSFADRLVAGPTGFRSCSAGEHVYGVSTDAHGGINGLACS